MTNAITPPSVPPTLREAALEALVAMVLLNKAIEFRCTSGFLLLLQADTARVEKALERLREALA